jgi:uncharacterized DUF497 family protein
MEVEWDDAKSELCLRERGFSFAYVVRAFADPRRRIEVDDRWEYGETRYRLYGRITGRSFVIIYTMRNGIVRIISARRANARERRRYGEGSDQG